VSGPTPFPAAGRGSTRSVPVRPTIKHHPKAAPPDRRLGCLAVPRKWCLATMCVSYSQAHQKEAPSSSITQAPAPRPESPLPVVCAGLLKFSTARDWASELIVQAYGGSAVTYCNTGE
jgi:hypothetical protein